MTKKLLIASAGAGKTHRIAEECCQLADDNKRVLVVTYTENNQKEISEFISYCKKHQDSNGYLNQDFFNFSEIKKGIFLSGPFTNLMFEVIGGQKEKLKILIGNITTTITKKNYYLYRSV